MNIWIAISWLPVPRSVRLHLEGNTLSALLLRSVHTPLGTGRHSELRRADRGARTHQATGQSDLLVGSVSSAFLDGYSVLGRHRV